MTYRYTDTAGIVRNLKRADIRRIKRAEALYRANHGPCASWRQRLAIRGRVMELLGLTAPAEVTS